MHLLFYEIKPNSFGRILVTSGGGVAMTTKKQAFECSGLT
jgi:hypothetical protein